MIGGYSQDQGDGVELEEGVERREERKRVFLCCLDLEVKSGIL